MKLDVFKTILTPLDRDVDFHVMVPNSYEEVDKRYPVLFINDGQDVFFDEESVTGDSLQFVSYYKSFGKFLPEVILVAIDCPMNNNLRTIQYTPYTKDFIVNNKNFESHIEGKGVEYLEWIIQELKPWVDANYRTMPQSQYTGIGGSGTAAIISTYAVLKYREVFSRLISISGAFYIWMDCIAQTLASAKVDHIKYIHMDVGTEEQGRMTKKEQFVEGNEMMYERFLKKGIDADRIRFNIHPGEILSPISWRKRFPDAIRWVFQDV